MYGESIDTTIANDTSVELLWIFVSCNDKLVNWTYKLRICSSSSINKVSSDQALKYMRNTQPPLKVSATLFVSGNKNIHT